MFGVCLVRFMGYCDAGMSVGVNFVGRGKDSVM